MLDLLEDPGLEVADVLRREKILLDDLKAEEKKSEASKSRDLPKVLRPIESGHNEPEEGDVNHDPVIKELRPVEEQSKDLEEGEEEEEDEEEGNEDKKEARKELYNV